MQACSDSTPDKTDGRVPPPHFAQLWASRHSCPGSDSPGGLCPRGLGMPSASLQGLCRRATGTAAARTDGGERRRHTRTRVAVGVCFGLAAVMTAEARRPVVTARSVPPSVLCRSDTLGKSLPLWSVATGTAS